MNSERQQIITRISILGIVTNLLIAAAKIILGLIAGSIAIISEGVNNATDAGSSFLALIGAKLSEKHPDEKHPFGYGRIEYLTSLVIGGLILYSGLGTLGEAIDGILHPSKMDVTILAIVVVAVTAVIKFFLGNYTAKTGEKIGAESLIAVGEDSRNDSYFSVVTIISSIIYMTTGRSLDAFAGLVFAAIIIKAGLETLMHTVGDLIGRTGEEELAKKLYKEIRETEGILSVADMMLHNYGPDKYSGSVNVEIDHKKNVGEVYEYLHELQLRLMHTYHVTMVFGIYAVDRDSAESKEMRRVIGAFVKEEAHVKSFHALYISKETETIYVDFIVDYKLRDWEKLGKKFTEYMKEKYPEYKLDLTIETEFV